MTQDLGKGLETACMFSVSRPGRLLSLVGEQVQRPTRDLRWSIERGRCFINGRVERFSSALLRPGDHVAIWPLEPPRFEREEARVLYEDHDLLLYDKPPYIDAPSLAARLGVRLIHRLDRDTTGVMACAKGDPTPYAALFRERGVDKVYYALVEGVPSQARGTLSGRMGKIGAREGASIWGLRATGVWSRTDWASVASGPQASLLRCRPLTGRTHQIRVHLRALGHPIVGDCEYGSRQGRAGIFRPLLHAHTLRLGALLATAPLPRDFLHAMFLLNIPLPESMLSSDIQVIQRGKSYARDRSQRKKGLHRRHR